MRSGEVATPIGHSAPAAGRLPRHWVLGPASVCPAIQRTTGYRTTLNLMALSTVHERDLFDALEVVARSPVDVMYVTAGESTPISLTFTMTFADTVGSSHIVLLEDVPAWFDVTAMTCSAPIAPADCTRAKLTDTLNQLVVESLTDADTMTVTLTGTATPAAAGTATAKGLGWILFDRGEAGLLDWCQNGTASVSLPAAEATAPPATPTPAPTAATATPTPIAATPPPTAAVGSGPTSDGGMTLVLPLLLATLGGLFVLARRRGRSRT